MPQRRGIEGLDGVEAGPAAILNGLYGSGLGLGLGLGLGSRGAAAAAVGGGGKGMVERREEGGVKGEEYEMR